MNDVTTTRVGTVGTPDGSRVVVVLPNVIGTEHVPGFVECALVPKAEYDTLVQLAESLNHNMIFRERIGGQLDPERALPTAHAAIKLVRASGHLTEDS